MFTEEFQVEFMREYHHVFDDLREKFLVGEMVWNFADFMTDQGVYGEKFTFLIFITGGMLAQQFVSFP